MGRSVAGIVQREDGLFLVAQRIPGGDMGERWEFPGGKVEEGETDEEALVREFCEELGVDVSVGEHLASARFTHHGREIPLNAYRVFLGAGGFRLTEHSRTAWVPFNEIAALDFADSDRLLLDQLAAKLVMRR